MKNEEMKTATTEAEFAQLLKEGKPFHLKAAHSITIAKLPGEQPPIVQITGDAKEITSMLFFAMSEIAEDTEKQPQKCFANCFDMTRRRLILPCRPIRYAKRYTVQSY